MFAVETENRFERYRSQVRRIPKLSREQEAALGRAWQRGDANAGSKLVEANLSTVMSIAWEYRRWGTALDDLVQQGSIGLLKAAKRFDPERDNRLRSYASYWIRAEIRDYVVRGYRMVRLGTTRTERRAMRAYRTSDIKCVEDLVERSGMPRARCEMLWPLLAQRDQATDDDQGGERPGLVLRDRQPDPEETTIRAQQQALRATGVADAMAQLTPRERDIVRDRFMTDEPHTLEEIGKRHGVSRERIRQLEKRAKEKMRAALEPLAH